MATAHNWPHWHAVWGEIRTSGISLAEFCRREKLSYDTCRKAFKRMEAKGEPGRKPRKTTKATWEAWKLEFLGGDFKSASDFVRSKGLDPGTGYVSRMTRGWSKQLSEIRAKSEAETVAAIADHKGAEAIARLHSRVLLALYQCLGDLEKNGPKRAALHKTIESAKDSLDLTRNVNVVIDGLLKLLPAVSRIEGTVGARDVLRRLAEQKVDVTGAAIAFEQMGVELPQTVKILLAKQEPPEPPEDIANSIPSDEELERRWRDGLTRIAEQEKTFLPERQREIAQLKEECKGFDSFVEEIPK